MDKKILITAILCLTMTQVACMVKRKRIKDQAVTSFENAIGTYQIDKARKLIENGLQVNVENVLDFIKALLLADKCFEELFDLFVKNTDVDSFISAVDSCGILLNERDEILFEKLLKLGADPNVTNSHGTTPLILAIIHKPTNLIELLLDANADINAQDYSGFTALMYAASYGHIDKVKMLLDKGADPDINNNNGYTALDLAEFNKKNNKKLYGKHHKEYTKFDEVVSMLNNEENNNLATYSDKKSCCNLS